MITVADWTAVEKWKLIPETGVDEEICSFSLYFEDEECDRFCAVFDACGFASIRMVNEDSYGYVFLSPEIMSSLAKAGKRVRKFFEEQW